MNTISIPLPKEYIQKIDALIKKGEFDNRSQLIRSAIKTMIAEREIAEIKEASARAKLGEIFEGDIDALAARHV